MLKIATSVDCESCWLSVWSLSKWSVCAEPSFLSRGRPADHEGSSFAFPLVCLGFVQLLQVKPQTWWPLIYSMREYWILARNYCSILNFCFFCSLHDFPGYLFSNGGQCVQLFLYFCFPPTLLIIHEGLFSERYAVRAAKWEADQVFFVLKLFRESFLLHGVRPPFVSKGRFGDPSQLLGRAKLLGRPVSLGTLVALKFIFQPQTVWGTTTWRTVASISRNRCCNYETIPSVYSEVWPGQRYMHPTNIQNITWFCNLGSMQTHIGPHCALIHFAGPCQLWDSFGVQTVPLLPSHPFLLLPSVLLRAEDGNSIGRFLSAT